VEGATPLDDALPAAGRAREGEPKVATAIARELTGFIWAIEQEVSPAAP
jgi:hypothetical protein